MATSMGWTGPAARLRRIGLGLVLTGFGTLGAPGPSGAQEPEAEAEPASRPEASGIAARIDAYANALAGEGQLSGTLLVAVDGAVVYERAFGMANYELGVANTVVTRHGIASVTKLLTAILTLRLAEEGHLDLDDPLSRFIPGFPRGNEITVDHLLRHRSGLPHRVTSDGDVATPRTPAVMVELARGAELLFEPGAERGYSSAGYSVLARVLEVAAGSRYAELLESKVFRPAAALHSVADDGRRIVPGRSADYLMGPGEPVPARPAVFSFLVGAGDVFSTPRDLLKVLEAVDAGTYGSRVRAELLGEEGSLRWNGQSFGYRAFVDYRSDGPRAVIFAGNLRTGGIDLLRDDVPRIASGERVSPPALPSREPVRWGADARRAVGGVYQFRAGEPDSEEALRFSPDGSYARLGSWVLVPVSRDELFSTTDYGTLTLIRTENGGVKGMEWRKGDASFFLPRVRGLPGPRDGG